MAIARLVEPAGGAALQRSAYERLLTSARYFLVAVSGDRVVGFLVGHTEPSSRLEEVVGLDLARRLGPAVVISEVAVAPEWQRRGIARALYRRILTEAGGQSVVALDPYPQDVAATRFHYAMGFEPYRTVPGPDGAETRVWLHRSRSPELLLGQYAHAIDLYKHEDTLTWNKLNNLLYITTALFTGYGVLATVSTNSPAFDRTDVLLLGICVLGLLASLAFLWTLVAGVRYLDARKAMAMHIEEQLVMAGGTRVIAIVDPRLSWLRRSPTRHLLRGLPIALAVAWLAAIVVSFIRI